MKAILPDDSSTLGVVVKRRIICREILKICGYSSATFLAGDSSELFYSLGDEMFYFRFDTDGFLIKMEREKYNGR